jgi:hypothetical protein
MKTMINGIPAALLAPRPEPVEDHAKREKWHPVPGTAAEGIAALNRLYARLGVTTV